MLGGDDDADQDALGRSPSAMPPAIPAARTARRPSSPVAAGGTGDSPADVWALRLMSGIRSSCWFISLLSRLRLKTMQGRDTFAQVPLNPHDPERGLEGGEPSA